jgi:hypothetical protein
MGFEMGEPFSNKQSLNYEAEPGKVKKASFTNRPAAFNTWNSKESKYGLLTSPSTPRANAL